MRAKGIKLKDALSLLLKVVYQADSEEEEEHVVKVLTRPSVALPVSHTRYIKSAL